MLRIESGPTSIAGVEVDAIVGSVGSMPTVSAPPTILWFYGLPYLTLPYLIIVGVGAPPLKID